jgi:oligopeptidase A
MLSNNPLLRVNVPVPFDEVRAEHVVPAIDAHLVTAQKILDGIVAAPSQRTYANTLGALDHATHELDYASNVASHLEAV